MSQTTFRNLYLQTCQILLDLQGEITEGKVGAFLQTSAPPVLPEATGKKNFWADQSIEPPEDASPEELPPDRDPIAHQLLNAVRNLEHLFDSAWEAGFKNEAQTCFYRLTRDLFDAIERDGYIPGREADDDDEEDEEEEDSAGSDLPEPE